jgi:Flp pilus assembly protein TadD
MATKAAKPRRPSKPPRQPAHERLPDTPDPIQIAMAAAASGKPLPDVARRVLEEQAGLIHAQRAELRLRHVGEFVRAALWAILAMLALAIVVMLVTVFVRAARTDALIVESFRVPPTLASQGLTGEVVATQVLDKIADFQERTDTIRAQSSYANDWGEDLKIDIPQTGATAHQLWKLLRGWLGKETRISGEVIQTTAGLALTARVGSTPGQRFVSDSDDLDALVTQAAEHIFGRTQPYRYSSYLFEIPERKAQSFAIIQQLMSDPSPTERKWAFNAHTVDLRDEGDFRGSIAAAERGLEIDPDMRGLLINAASTHFILGHDQAALDLNVRADKVKRLDEYDPERLAQSRCGASFEIGMLSMNPNRIDSAISCPDGTSAGYQNQIRGFRAAAALLRHDWRPAAGFHQVPFGSQTAESAARQTATVRLFAQMERGPTPALAQALDSYRAAGARIRSVGDRAAYYRAIAPTLDWPLEAEALAMLGRTDEAADLIAKTPRDCYECLRASGKIAQAQGNLPGAQRWFVEAVRQGPRLAPAYVDWGKLLIRARRFESAEAKLARAAKLSPNWADPMKYWGDALAAQGNRRKALARYDAAFKLAPKWEELQRDRAKLGTPS